MRFHLPKRSRRTALTEGLIAGILFGTSSIFIRLLLDDLNVFSLAFWRLIIASAILVGAVLVLRKSFNLSMMKANIKQFSILATLLGLHMFLYISAVKNTTILGATVLVNTAPIFSMLISSFHFNLKPSRLAMMGLATSFLGAGLIGYAHASTSLLINLRGDLEAILAAIAEALYLSYGREIRSKTPLFSQVIPIYLLSAFIIGFPCALTRTPITLPSQPRLILFLLGFGILPTTLGHTLYYSSLSNLKSFETATLALLEPIGATLLGIALFDEIPGALFVLGALLVLSGIVSVTLKE